MLIINN